MSKSREKELDELLLDIHAAVTQPIYWQSVAERSARLLNADHALLFAMPTKSKFSWFHSVDMDPDALTVYATEFVAHDIWLNARLATGRTWTGLVSNGDALLDRRDFLRSRFFNEYLKRYDIDRFLNVVLAGPSMQGGNPSAVLSFFRGLGKAEFSQEEGSLLERLTPHLVLATQNCHFAQSLCAASQTLTQALNSVAAATFTIDSLGNLCDANVAAEAELRSARFVRLVGARVCAADTLINSRELERVLRQGSIGLGSSLILESRKTGAQSLLVIAPAARAAGLVVDKHHPACVMWLSVLKVATEALDDFATQFKLSPSERKLLNAFVDCEELNAAAEMLGRSIHTARAQMKSIMRKTNRRSQGQLLAAIAQFSAIARRKPGSLKDS